jgi:prepilin-type processing-associated H-X9-DG protein
MAVEDAKGRFTYQNEIYDWAKDEVARIGGPWICPAAPIVAEPQALVMAADAVLGTARSAYTNSHPTYDLSEDYMCVIRETPRRPRASSYLVNMDLFFSVALRPYSPTWDPAWDHACFLQENEVKQPGLTPVLADGPCPFGWFNTNCLPPSNLVNPFEGSLGMIVAMPRHGSHPNPVPTRWPADKPLPGAINVLFYDGHVEMVKLDKLWQLYWNKAWEPPAKRPGLP